MIRSYTPWETHLADGIPVRVKREDLCAPYPGPAFSKVRGVGKFLIRCMKTRGRPTIGVLDTLHSKAGWGVAWLCEHFGLPCAVFFPVYKSERVGLKTDNDISRGYYLRENQIMARGFGAITYGLPAGRSCILYHTAKRMLKESYPNSIMLPNGLCLQESADETARELYLTSHDAEYRNGTWVISASSGTIAKGLIDGLVRLGAGADVICHMGYSRSETTLRKYVTPAGGLGGVTLKIVNEGYAYKDAVKYDVPFPCNPYYDLKAWKWLCENIKGLRPPVVFWNIGA